MARFALVASRLAAVVAFAHGAASLGCRDDRESERRAAREATSAAEHLASEGMLTGASVDRPDAAAEDERALGEVVAAFQLEQADYRVRLRRALDAIDRQGPRSPAQDELRERLTADLAAVDRATEPDWATLRTKVERDLAGQTGRR